VKRISKCLICRRMGDGFQDGPKVQRFLINGDEVSHRHGEFGVMVDGMEAVARTWGRTDFVKPGLVDLHCSAERALKSMRMQ
jgi:hypothetical protein